MARPTDQLSKDELLDQIQELKRQLQEVNEEKDDLEIILETVTEHATNLENQIRQKNEDMEVYIQEVEKVTAAAAAVENNTFIPESLDEVAARNDELGRLARVFAQGVKTLKTRERELEIAKEQLEAVLNAVPGSISWLDANGVYIGVNCYLAEHYNLSQDAFIGQELGFINGNAQFAEFMHQFLASSKTSDSQIVEVSVADGVRYFLIAAQKYQQGNATVSVGIDITERKKAEEALRIAEENYRSIYENALEGIFQSSPDGHYISVNPAMARLYGYNSAEELIESVTEIDSQVYVDPNCKNQFQYLIEQQAQVKDFEYQVYRKDGSIIWVEENTRAVRDTSGNLLYYEGMIQDITERKRQEEQLKRQLQELQIEIDQQKRKKEVAAITQSDYFQELQAEAELLRFDEDW